MNPESAQEIFADPSWQKFTSVETRDKRLFLNLASGEIRPFAYLVLPGSIGWAGMPLSAEPVRVLRGLVWPAAGRPKQIL